MDFNFGQVVVTEFGVCTGEEGADQQFYAVPVDVGVQEALGQMAVHTWELMQANDPNPRRYEPSESYASSEHLTLPIDDDLAQWVRRLHEATNLQMHNNALAEPSNIVCYFSRMTDGEGRHLTCLRRATQFKGILRSRLISWFSDALKIIDEQVFRLDTDFDLLADSSQVHILRPSGFEFAGQLTRAVLEAVPRNVAALSADLQFVDFDNIQEYAMSHPRAARYLASIRSQRGLANIERGPLTDLCERTGVQVQESQGRIMVEDGQVMAFLEVLDRRRYGIDLVRDAPELYRASSRRLLER